VNQKEIVGAHETNLELGFGRFPIAVRISTFLLATFGSIAGVRI
jgi:hypothetical protein